MFPRKGTKGKGRPSDLKILTSKQMLQKLQIVLAQVKAGNTSENLLNEVRKNDIFFCIEHKKLLKKYIAI